MVPPEPSQHTTGRLDHSNLDDIEENDFKKKLLNENDGDP